MLPKPITPGPYAAAMLAAGIKSRGGLLKHGLWTGFNAAAKAGYQEVWIGCSARQKAKAQKPLKSSRAS